ncbi:MAG: phosphomannomutase/phosphoglucomutase [Halioglobus sp.]|nr:phosphomannomutase/phosphoglucomutase [Halioglobus sp.]
MLKLKKKRDEEAPPAVAEAEASPQGIAAQGNALRKAGMLALTLSLVPLLAAFAYLLVVREPALEAQQIDRISSSYAAQQATNVHSLLTRLQQRVLSAAGSPLALSAIASQAQSDIALVEKALLDFFPEVISLRFIPIGDLGTADFTSGNRGLRNHIEVDLVRRASRGDTPEPEAYKFEEGWLTSMAAQVTHPRLAERRAVIIVTVNNEEISAQLQALDNAGGRFELEQVFQGDNKSKRSAETAERVSIIAASGSGDKGEHTRIASVPDTPWRVSFSPSAELVGALTVDRTPLVVVAAVLALAIIGAITTILRGFPKTMASEVDKVLSAADSKSALSLQVPELVPLAKQLRRATLRALRQNTDPTAELSLPEAAQHQPTGEMANPLFQSTSILDQEEESLDLDLAGGDEEPVERTEPGGAELPQHIFRAYDIRGTAQEDLTDATVTLVGGAIGTKARAGGEQTLVVGCDGRLSSPRIKSALIRAILETGCDVIDIGLVPTPLLYFATRHLPCRSGVMVTGSHNPPGDNGLKIVLDQQTIAAGGIQEIRELAAQGNFATGSGHMTREDVIPAYLDEVLQDIAIAVPLKIVIDAGNGATSGIAPRLFEELGCEVEPLYCEVDGNFPNHAPDTSNEDNLKELCQVTKQLEADFGVAFDGDGDRLAVVTRSGQIIRSDVLLMLFAQDVVSRNPGADVVFDVKCSRNLSQLITRHGGRPVLWKTGHAFMKEKMRETGALLGGEFSGHMFFGERWYGFDDGMYAAARLAEILSTHGDTLDDCIADFPTSVNTPEIIIPVADDYKFQLVEKIAANADFASGKITTMDGVRVDFSNGWGLVRASNTGPALTARFEADNQENLEIIQDEFRAQIALVDPEIDLSF